MLKIIFIAVVCWVIGVFGFAQIIGSLQNIKQRGFGASIITILIWTIILGGAYCAVNKYFNSSVMGLYIGYGISLIQILFSGKIS